MRNKGNFWWWGENFYNFVVNMFLVQHANLPMNSSERPKMAELAPRRGPLLGPLWADWAEILRGKRARVWLRMIQISLGWVELRGGSGQKTEKNG